MDPIAFEKEIERNLLEASPSGRLFHGRGHCFPGLEFLTVDRHPGFLIVCLFEERPEAEVALILEILESKAEAAGISACVVQHRYRREDAWEAAWGVLPPEPYAEELGLRYGLTLMTRQNHGFFVDMLEGRKWVAGQARGARVLNLFSYTCSFSVVAAAHGCRSVVNVDLSKAALRLGKQNHDRNGLQTPARYLPHDVMRSFGRLNRLGPFDLVICDPPTYQKNAFDAERSYPKLARRLLECTAAGGRVVACLNAPHLPVDFLKNAFAAQGWQFVTQRGRPETCPEQDADHSLKILVFEKAEEVDG